MTDPLTAAIQDLTDEELHAQMLAFEDTSRTLAADGQVAAGCVYRAVFAAMVKDRNRRRLEVQWLRRNAGRIDATSWGDPPE
jgi:hypothetical protein